jgi:hypothetical protein
MTEPRMTIAERARSFAEICKAEGVDEAVATDMIRLMLTRRGGVTNEIAAKHAARAVAAVYQDVKHDSRGVGYRERRDAYLAGKA